MDEEDSQIWGWVGWSGCPLRMRAQAGSVTSLETCCSEDVISFVQLNGSLRMVAKFLLLTLMHMV